MEKTSEQPEAYQKSFKIGIYGISSLLTLK